MKTIAAVVTCCLVVFAGGKSITMKAPKKACSFAAAWVDDWQPFSDKLFGVGCVNTSDGEVNCTEALCTLIDAEIRMLLTFNVKGSSVRRILRRWLRVQLAGTEDSRNVRAIRLFDQRQSKYMCERQRQSFG